MVERAPLPTPPNEILEWIKNNPGWCLQAVDPTADHQIKGHLIQIGITPEYLARQIKELIELCNDKAFLTKDGKLIYSKQYKVVQGMIEGLKLALQLTGQMPAQQHEIIMPRSPVERKEMMEIAREVAIKIRDAT